MSIIDIKRMWRGNDSDASSDEGGKNRQRGSRDAWTIVVDNPTTANAVLVRQEAALNYSFAVGNSHPDDSYMTLRSIRVSRLSPNLFMLEATSHAKGTEPGESPLDEPPQIEQGHASTQTGLDVAIDGTPITTVNGEPFQGVTDEINELVITVSRNLPSWDYLLAHAYMGSGKTPAAVNSDDFMGFPPGTARLKGLSARSVEGDDFIYFSATGIVQFRAAAPGSTDDKAWWLRIRHEGFKIRDDADDEFSKWHHATDGDGNKETQPVMLKLDGTRETDPTVGHWLEFQTSPSLPFAELGFF